MSSPVPPLIESLFRVALARAEQPLPAVVEQALSQASESDWALAVTALEPHRVLPLLHFQLSRLGFVQHVPQALREQLKQAHDEVRVMNTVLVLSAATLLRSLAQQGQTPLLMKGVVLAEGYYPDFAARPMGDIDVVAAPGYDERMFEVLRSLGYAPASGVEERDALVLRAPSGAVCDAHRRLRLFEGFAWNDFTQETELSRLRGLRVRVFEPNAMVVHSVAHMTGHLRDLGPMLLWIVDLALIIRKHAAEIELSRVLTMLRDPQMRTMFLRVLSLLSNHGEVLNADLAEACSVVPELSLSTILRQRKLTPWGLPAPIGWVRLCAHHLALREYEQRRVPDLQDLVLWPVDTISMRLISRLLARRAA